MMVMPRPLGTLAFLLAWLVPWRPAFRVRAGAANLAFFVRHRDTIGRHIAKYGTHEPLVTHWIAEYLATARPGIVVDIGANVGWHALHAAQHRNVETVVAFEPDALNAWLLERNIAENGIANIVVDCRAVGAKPGVANLFRYKDSNTGRHSMAADHGMGSRPVPLTDLDSALDNFGFGNRTVALIKIDVEGYEPAVIAGAGRTLAHTDAIILEYSPDLSRAGALSTDEMMVRLGDAGFVPFVLRYNGDIVRTDRAELRGLEGSLDIIWLKTDIARKMPGKERGALTLVDIALQNKKVVKPI